jgi:hypothetical protein
MRTATDAKQFPIEQIESMFSRQKAEEKAFKALPTLEFYFTIMSDDRDLLEEDDEDPCQKYSQRGYGKTKELAEKDAKERFHDEWGDDLEIYWIKCDGLYSSLNRMSL